MKKTIAHQPAESHQPLFIRQLSPEMKALLEKHFWCDFSDVIPALSWEEQKTGN